MRMSNTFNGGTDTATITTGNSDDFDSGTAFGGIVITNGTLTYSTNTRDGIGLAAKSLATAGSCSAYCLWSVIPGSPYPAFYTRMYLNQTVRGTGNNYLQRFLNVAGSATNGWVGIDSTGHVAVFNNTQTNVGTSTMTLSTGTWYRIETYIIADPTAGQIICRIYSTVEGLTPAETLDSGATRNTGTAGDIGRCYFGLQVGTNTTEVYFDDVAVVNDTWIGPVDQLNILNSTKFVNPQAVYRM